MGGFRPRARSALTKLSVARGGKLRTPCAAGRSMGAAVMATVWQVWHIVQVWQWVSFPLVSTPVCSAQSAAMAVGVSCRWSSAVSAW